MNRATNVLAPRALTLANGAAGSGVMRIPVTTSGGTFVIPSTFADRFVQVYAEGCNCDFLCGISGTTCALDTQSAVDGTTKAVTINAATGVKVYSGQRISYRLPPASIATHVAYDADATGSLVFEMVE